MSLPNGVFGRPAWLSNWYFGDDLMRSPISRQRDCGPYRRIPSLCSLVEKTWGGLLTVRGFRKNLGSAWLAAPYDSCVAVCL